MGVEDGSIRIAAIADVHCYSEVRERLRYELRPANDEADVLVLPGDLTLLGKVEEAEMLAEDLRQVHVPIVAVLGNHDFEGDRQDTIALVLEQAGVHVLDGTTATFECRGRRVGFAGVKGFCGGFGDRLLAPFGESPLKEFVRVGQREADRLAAALEKLRNEERVDHVVAVTHYAPIRDTVVGEPAEIFPFLGSTRLCEPIDRFLADVAFHGHAHYGSPAGRSPAGIPVYNVARPLVKSLVFHELQAEREREIVLV